jgi:hypothetical protein
MVLVQTDRDRGMMMTEWNGSLPGEVLFKGRHFDGQIIILCVSWYASFKLSLRDLFIMMVDRVIPLAHTTILRWIQHYLPEREALEQTCSSYRRILEDGRDLYKASRAMGEPKRDPDRSRRYLTVNPCVCNRGVQRRCGSS